MGAKMTSKFIKNGPLGTLGSIFDPLGRFWRVSKIHRLSTQGVTAAPEDTWPLKAGHLEAKISAGSGGSGKKRRWKREG